MIISNYDTGQELLYHIYKYVGVVGIGVFVLRVHVRRSTATENHTQAVQQAFSNPMIPTPTSNLRHGADLVEE